MRTASDALKSLLSNNKQFRVADLYTFTLEDGTILRYTSADFDVKVGTNTFSSVGPVISSSPFKVKCGLEVDEMQMTIAAKPTDLIEGVPFMVAVRTGALDGATVLKERAFMPTWGDTSVGTVELFFGMVADIGEDSLAAKITVKTMMELLNINMPKYVTQPGCVHSLFDAGCTLAKNDWKTSTTVQAGSTATSIVTASLGKPNDYFTKGMIIVTSGACQGSRRTVIAFANGILSLLIPLPVVPALGDSIDLYAGCDKTQKACQTKFSNLANFKGFPYIPVPETSIGLSNG